MSRPITVVIPHQLGAAEARRRIEQGFAEFAGRMMGSPAVQLSRTWTGDSMAFAFGALGQSITGQLCVQQDAVRVEMILPGFLGIMASVMRGRVQQQGRLLLDGKPARRF